MNKYLAGNWTDRRGCHRPTTGSLLAEMNVFLREPSVFLWLPYAVPIRSREAGNHSEELHLTWRRSPNHSPFQNTALDSPFNVVKANLVSLIGVDGVDVNITT